MAKSKITTTLLLAALLNTMACERSNNENANARTVSVESVPKAASVLHIEDLLAGEPARIVGFTDSSLIPPKRVIPLSVLVDNPEAELFSYLPPAGWLSAYAVLIKQLSNQTQDDTSNAASATLDATTSVCSSETFEVTIPRFKRLAVQEGSYVICLRLSRSEPDNNVLYLTSAPVHVVSDDSKALWSKSLPEQFKPKERGGVSANNASSEAGAVYIYAR